MLNIKKLPSNFSFEISPDDLKQHIIETILPTMADPNQLNDYDIDIRFETAAIHYDLFERGCPQYVLSKVKITLQKKVK